MNDNNCTFYEFDIISCGDGEKQIPKKAFQQLKNFIVPNTYEQAEDADFSIGEIPDVSQCLTLCVRDGKEAIQVKNYVGTIALPCGVSIEILPKIAKRETEKQSRKLVIEMLKACGLISYKSFQNANIQIDKLNLFEVYIRLFLNEVNALVKKGLRAGYVTEQSNERFLKGKILFNEQIKNNLIHQERFYVRHDEFSFNKSENRIIKTTLRFVQKISKDDLNRKDIRRLVLLFDEIDYSSNIDADFVQCAHDRTAKDYETVLMLCKVFLRKKSFSMFGGANNVVALLFPMEKLFEKYIAHEMQTYAAQKDWRLSAQDTGKYLFDNYRFALKPDIVLKNGTEKIIVDTKWKRLTNNIHSNYGMSQADMYQMYAYHTRYKDIKRVVLLYPLYENVSINDYVIADMKVTVSVLFIDLLARINGKSFAECLSSSIL